MSIGEMRRWVGLLVVAFGLVPGACAAPDETREPRVWAHMCSWFTLPNRAHNRKDWPLGLGLERWPGTPYRVQGEDGLVECRLASDAGIDAFAVDIFTWWPQQQLNGTYGRYVKSAEAFTKATGRPFFAAPCLDGLGRTTPEKLAAMIEGLCTAHAASPAWPKLDGRPVVWTYDGTSMPLTGWQEAFRLLDARGCRVVVIVDAFGWVNTFPEREEAAGRPWGKLPESDLDAWAALPIAFYRFRTDGRPGTLERAWRYLQAVHPESLAARLSIGTLWPGYWSSGNGWFVDPKGTARLRESFDAARSCKWLTVTTWNDYGETTQIEPGLAFGTGRLDLVHALVSEWRGDAPWPADGPRVYVTHPNEVQVGVPFAAEVLALLRPQSRAPAVTLVLEDASGKALSTHRVAPGGGRVATGTGEFRLDALPEQRWVRLRASDGKRSQVGVPIPVWPAGYYGRPTRRGAQWRLGSIRAEGPEVSIEREAGVPARVRVTWAGAPAGAFVHLRRNATLLHYPEGNATEFVCDLGRTYGEGRPSWEVFHPLDEGMRWGFFDAVGVSPDGTLYHSAPVWVEPAGGTPLSVAGYWALDGRKGDHAGDSSPHRNTAVLGGETKPQWVDDGARGGCLRFDGKSSRLTPPGGIFPSGSFTLEVSVRPEPPEGAQDLGSTRIIFADINAPLVLSLRADGCVEAYRAKPGGTARVVSPTPIPFKVWSRVTVTYDLRELSLYINGVLAATAPCDGERAPNVAGIGYNPFGAGSSYFLGCLDEIRLEGGCRPPGVK